MIDRRRFQLLGTSWAAILGLLGLALVSATPTFASHSVPGAAPNNCGQPNWTVGVAFIGLQTAQNLVLQQQPDLSFQGQFTARVRCMDQFGNDIGVVPHATLSLWTTVPGTSVNGIAATSSANPALIPAPDGTVTLVFTSNSALLPINEFFGKVGQDTIQVTVGFSNPVPAGSSPLMLGNIFAATPELSSLALFASGVAGMAASVALRVRARSRPSVRSRERT